MIFVVLCPGTPEGSTCSGSGFKASQKTGKGLKSHLTDWEKRGIEPATPGLQDIGLFPTPRRLLINRKSNFCEKICTDLEEKKNSPFFFKTYIVAIIYFFCVHTSMQINA